MEMQRKQSSSHLVAVESINNINNINNNNNTNDTNNKVTFKSVTCKETKANSSSRPVGQTASPEGLGESQEAEGVSQIGPPKMTLFQERSQLKQAGQWLTQNDIDYLSVSFYLNEPNNLDSIKCQYSFKTRGNGDLKNNKFSSKFTRNRFDFIRNVEQRWNDYTTQAPFYRVIHNAIDLGLKEGYPVYGAKSLPVKKFGSKTKTALVPYGANMLYFDGDWHFDLWHHDFNISLSYPGELWQEDLQRWINQWAIQLEQPKTKRPRNVPPFVKLVWSQ
jgi:hypothetical protein